MRQYEIWWADLPRPIGRRPVLLLSRDAAYEYLAGVVVVEVTSTVRDIPVEVRLGSAEGLRRVSVANFDNVHVIPRRLPKSRIGRLRESRIGEAKRALGFALGWPELKAL